MTVHPVRAPGREDHHERVPWSKLAFGLAAVVAVVVVVAVATFAIAFAIGGEDATADNWVGVLAVFGVVGGLLASIGAFALAVIARVAHERSRLLWLPWLLFPSLLAFLVLGELLWWE